jgi:hypothetical protein
MDERKDGTLKFRTTTSVDGGRREGLPHDLLAYVGGDKQGDTRTQAIAFLEQFVEKNDYQSGNNKLDNQKNADTETEFRRRTIETREDVDASLTKGHDDGEHCCKSQSKFGNLRSPNLKHLHF